MKIHRPLRLSDLSPQQTGCQQRMSPRKRSCKILKLLVSSVGSAILPSGITLWVPNE